MSSTDLTFSAFRPFKYWTNAEEGIYVNFPFIITLTPPFPSILILSFCLSTITPGVLSKTSNIVDPVVPGSSSRLITVLSIFFWIGAFFPITFTPFNANASSFNTISPRSNTDPSSFIWRFSDKYSSKPIFSTFIL